MDYLSPHTIADSRQVVTRRVGDVVVTLDMPEGMAAPYVELRLHTTADVAGRLRAIDALGMTDEEHLREPDGLSHYWYSRREGSVHDGVEAVVYFERTS